MKSEFQYHEDYIKNSRGVELFACRWIPSSSPKALVFLCHGYGMECSDSMRAQEECMEKGRFLYGESMGGAVTLLLHKKDPSFWNGAILVAPMCKISEKVKPHPVVINLLTRVEEMIPKWKIVPTKNVINAAFKDLAKREEVKNNKLIYQDKPRLKTALEMLRTSMNLEDTDQASLTVTPVRATATASVERDIVTSNGKRRGKRRSYLNLLCGLNGGRLVPRSGGAM
ncbi:hypothetical protein DY000_02036142 [Brassica cretica]|uniref:Serine aminopeptidase S33 domain-containing protein n=1 Tax=Brassica cretica TaxID=69181 RepID=A0ABQ7DU22_BRACR|nr:hypothetical protein DY000_02036142 [Brassica cretica]